MSQIVTGDAVVLDLRPARVPSMLLAAVVDLAVISLATSLFGYVISVVAGGYEYREQTMTMIGAIVFGFGYPIASETATRGRTLGSWALGLRVVRDDGGAIRFRQALLRGMGFWFADFAPWTGFCGGLICASIHPQSKRIGDLAAGTLMVRVRSPRRPQPIPPVPAELTGWTSQLQLSGLSDELVTASRQLVQRHDGLLPYPKEQLAQELARQVAARTAPAPPVALPARDFLAAVIAERRDREQRRLAEGGWVPTAAELPDGWR
ncbi:RDD family protein [Microlunatus parietis]|uniref:Putative RDD family membrane protein YckC n=1 Tax=Microlunatus parietis TaxID=682979 RepID=A0A7Y9I5K8_9ACTN|nr:RDD family protein [Microlunatus parietis]NYE70617.1 putative RDD family membrane protein YckC [Microlunatus parietis]